MPKADNLGSFETVVLLAVMRLQQTDNAYGATIARELEARTSRWILVPVVYESLEPMRKKGYLVCRQEDEPTPHRGGKRRRFYRLTAEGETVINLAVRDVFNLAEGLPLWGDVRNGS